MKKLFSIIAFIALMAINSQTSFAQNVEVSTGGPITNYTTIKAAFDAINAGTHSGVILIELASNTTETEPAVLNSSGAGSASYSSITIRPRVDGIVISSPTTSGRGVIELNGADNVTIDGDNPNSFGLNRNLTITNTATSTITYTSAIRIALSTLVTSGNSNTIKNCILNGSATGRNISTATSTTGSEHTTYGILVGGGASTVSATTAPSAITSINTVIGSGITATSFTVDNNQINSCARGIAVQGSATTVANLLTVTNNVIGSSTSGNTTTVYSRAMTLQGFDNTVISGNTIRNIESYIGTSIFGIALGEVNSSGTNAVVEKNTIIKIFNQHTNTLGAHGIALAAGSTITVRNNFISDINHVMTGGVAFGSTNGVNGIRITAGINHKIYFNTVSLFGAFPGTANSSLSSACFLISSTTLTGIDTRNNIFSNTMTGGTTSIAHVSILLPSAGTSTMNLTLNNNAYYSGSASNQGIAHVGTSFATIYTAANFNPGSITPATNLRAYTSTLSASGTNDNASFATTDAAPFISSTDLHINSSISTGLESGGTPISGITTDFDGETRNVSTPDIGADEGNFSPLASMTYVSSTTIQNNTTFVGSGTINAEIIGIQIVMSGSISPLNLTSIELNTNGSTNPGTDILNAKVWYTGTSSSFATTTQFGSTFTGPSGSFTLSGTQLLSSGTNYFWITYDINSGATSGNLVDAECNSLTGSGSMGSQIPTLQAPAGSRQILSPLSGTYTVGGVFDNFLSLTGTGGAFERINSLGLQGNVILQITSDINETGLNALNQWSESGAGSYTINIVPSSASEKVISGSVAGSMIRFNGADRVTIDGNNGFSGSKYLRFRNTNGSNPTISLTNDSKRNTISNCFIESNNSSTITTNAGTILIGTTTGTNGNDSNTISWCDIRDRSDAAGYPAYGIVSAGTSTKENDYITISNCNIYNFFAEINPTTGILLLTGTGNNCIITSNSLYQTGIITATTAVSTIFNCINANNAAINNLTISNNFIGGSGPGATGTWTCNSSATGIMGVCAINISALGSTTASNIDGNIIRNFNITSTAISTFDFFDGIVVQAGTVHIGSNTGNIIGSPTGTGSIVGNWTTGGTLPIACIPITNNSIAGGNINNNTIGSITFNAGAYTGTYSFYGISRSGAQTTAINVNNNTVGSTSTSNSIQTTGTAFVCSMRGLYINIGTTGGPHTINSNTISNIYNSSAATSTSSYVNGLYTNETGAAGTIISGNTFSNFTCDANNTTTGSGFTCVSGVRLFNNNSVTFTQNIINNLTSNNPSGNTKTVGLNVNFSMTGTTISRNRIYDLKNTSTGTTPAISGILFTTGTTISVTNNQISITNGEITDINNTNIKNTENSRKEYNKVNTSLSPIIINKKIDNNKVSSDGSKVNNNLTAIRIDYSAEENARISKENTILNESYLHPQVIYENDASTNGLTIAGIEITGGTSHNYYYNSVYIGGTASSGSYNSYSLLRTGTAANNFKNNLLVNARTGGTGKSYAASVSSATGWAANSSNYNAFVVTDTNTTALWTGVDKSISSWRTSSNCDKQTWSTLTSTINPSNLFTSISTGNLNINTANTEAWIVSGKGIAISGQNTDYNGEPRFVSIASGTTDIGADEFGTLATTPPSATVDTLPGSGKTSTYTLWGRSLVKIVWGANGSEYPSLDVKYYSGINPPNVLGGNYSNSYTDINATGILTGATYDITYYFGDNETYTIGTPGVSTILAKYNTNWEVYHLVQPENNSVLTYNTGTQTYTVAVNGLYDFSTFALTDDGSALPVTLENFDISVVKRDAVLNWTTTSELNNKGFGIERRVKNATGYSDWKEISFVNGNGTSNERHMYSYKDAKILSGVYQYRLKQVDYNNNSEYYQPTNNSDVIIGKPGSFDVSQNYPNPSNPKSKIDFQMPFDGKVSIKVYDILGQQVASLIDEFKQADFYTVEFDGSNIASGTYFYRIIAEGDNQKFTKTLKMILVK